MNFEDLQKASQSQDASAKVTINAKVQLKEVRRNQQHFRAGLFWRDLRGSSRSRVGEFAREMRVLGPVDGRNMSSGGCANRLRLSDA